MTAPIVPDEDVRELLDIIAESMDFGSGFLDTPQVAMLRRVAHMVGMNPNDLTPPNMPHDFEPWPEDELPTGIDGVSQRQRERRLSTCRRCSQGKDHGRHVGWPPPAPNAYWNEAWNYWEIPQPKPAPAPPVPPKPSKFTLNLMPEREPQESNPGWPPQ